MVTWLVQFLGGTQEYQLRVGDSKAEVMLPDEITGQPALDARPESFFPSDQWLILKRKKNGVTLAIVIPKHDIEVS